MINGKIRLASSYLALATAIGTALMATPVLAQTADDTAEAQAKVDDDLHNRQADGTGNIIVSASGLKELDVLGAHLGPHRWPAAVRMIESGTLPLDKICTHQLPLEEFQKGLDLVDKGTDSIKVTLIP